MVPALPPPGVYKFGAVIDPSQTIQELIPGRTSFVGGEIGLGFGPDWTISSLSGPFTAMPGSPINITLTVCNQGTAPAPPTDLELFFSVDKILKNDPVNGRFMLPSGQQVPPLDVGVCSTLSLMVPALPPSGVYFLGATVNQQNQQAELLTDNDGRVGAQIGLGFGPSLAVTSLSGPPSAHVGDQIALTYTVCNHGTISAPPTTIAFFLTIDGKLINDPINGRFEFAMQEPVPPLDAGTCVQATSNQIATPPPGTYQLGALVDPFGTIVELLPGTQSRLAGTMTMSF
jgi:hypothetical protein